MNIYIFGSLTALQKQQEGSFFYLQHYIPSCSFLSFFAISDLFADVLSSPIHAWYFLSISSLIVWFPMFYLSTKAEPLQTEA